MKMKIKNRSQTYDINRPRPRHGDKYSKYKKSLNMMSKKKKQELRVASSSSDIPVTSSNPRVTSSNPRVTSSNPRVTSWVHELRLQIQELRVQIDEFED